MLHKIDVDFTIRLLNCNDKNSRSILRNLSLYRFPSARVGRSSFRSGLSTIGLFYLMGGALVASRTHPLIAETTTVLSHKGTELFYVNYLLGWYFSKIKEIKRSNPKRSVRELLNFLVIFPQSESNPMEIIEKLEKWKIEFEIELTYSNLLS